MTEDTAFVAWLETTPTPTPTKVAVGGVFGGFLVGWSFLLPIF